jgi:hypothetical protein
MRGMVAGAHPEGDVQQTVIHRTADGEFFQSNDHYDFFSVLRRLETEDLGFKSMVFRL